MRARIKSLLKNPLFLPGLCLALAMLFAGGAYVASGWIDEEVQREYSSQQRRLRKAQKRYDVALREVDIANEYLARFNDYRAKKLLGETDRLQWSDQLIKIGKRLNIQDLEFDFEGREAMDRELLRYFDVDQKIYNAFELGLKFKLQHEQDLFTLLEMIANYISPMFSVNYCKLSTLRTDSQVFGFTESGNLKVRCELQVLEALPRQYDD